MIRVGLTGGIGSGKTYISQVFRALGVPVFNADQHAKKAYFDSEIQPDLINLLGADIISNNILNTQVIAARIFSNPSLLSRVNTLIHPWVENEFNSWADNMSAFPYILKEAAILFESGSYKNLDQTICVTAPEQIRISRVMERDKIKPGEVRSRMDRQWPQDKKINLATWVINNDGTNLVLPQIIDIHNRLRKY